MFYSLNHGDLIWVHTLVSEESQITHITWIERDYDLYDAYEKRAGREPFFPMARTIKELKAQKIIAR